MSRAKGFTLIELLVSITVIALLISIILPAVQQTREAARKSSCNTNLKQIALAAENYQSTYGVYPNGTVHKYQILPMIEQVSIYNKRNQTASDPREVWGLIQGEYIPIYNCPSDPLRGDVEDDDGKVVASTSYMACSGSGILENGFDGVYGYVVSPLPDIYPDQHVSSTDIYDGTSSTVAFSETLKPGDENTRIRNIWVTVKDYLNKGDMPEFQSYCESLPPSPEEYGHYGGAFSKGNPWYGGGMGTALYNHALPPNSPSCHNGSSVLTGIYSASSMHYGGVFVVYADGHTSFVSHNIDRKAWRELSSRASGLYQPPF